MKKIFSILSLSLVSSFALAEDLGKTTYEIACSNCHAPNVSQSIKAPTAFDKKAWDERFRQAKLEAEKNPDEYKSAIDYLLYKVTIGKGLMHHGGLCKEADVPKKDCSNKALEAAIHYMSGQ